MPINSPTRSTSPVDMPNHDEDHYRLRIVRPAVVALTTTLPEKVAHAAYAFITGPLLLDPRRVRKPLYPPLAPAYCARRGDYRILYLIDNDAKTVNVTAIAHRGSSYRTGPDNEWFSPKSVRTNNICALVALTRTRSRTP